MRNIIFTLVLLTTSLYGQGTIVSRPNYFRGQTYYQNGRYLGQSRQNIFGGQNYYNNQGRYFMRSIPTLNGGYRYNYIGNGYRGYNNSLRGW